MSVNSEMCSTNIKDNEQNNYALQVALKTMQERCQQLQQRLAIVEDENLNLRLKCGQDKMLLETDSARSEVDVLQNKVAQLTKQKSQLTHNVFMVATENRHLWNRLSKLTNANTSLGNQLLRIKDTLNQHSLKNNNDYDSDINKLINYSDLPRNMIKSRKECDEEQTNASLEEISLKLIDSFLKEKSELEHQYAQMVEMQSGESIDANSIGFTYLDDDKDSLIDLKHYSEELYKSKNELHEQHTKLKFILEALMKVKSDGLYCLGCSNKSSEVTVLNKSVVMSPSKLKESPKLSKNNMFHEVDQQQNGICPMCGKLFRYAPFKDFQKHVEEHFVDDYLVDNYEIVTNLGI